MLLSSPRVTQYLQIIPLFIVKRLYLCYVSISYETPSIRIPLVEFRDRSIGMIYMHKSSHSICLICKQSPLLDM